MLQKMLEHEHKVRDYLERLQTRQDGSALSIPNFLPPKVSLYCHDPSSFLFYSNFMFFMIMSIDKPGKQMKEMLAELAMVENEITRLESLITRLQAEVEHEKQMYKALGRHSLRTSHQSSQLLQKPNEKGTFDTKALHFISKAIKGDYHLSDFTHANDLKSAVFSSQKENRFREDGEEYREKVSKRNGALKPPSPLRDQPRHLTPRVCDHFKLCSSHKFLLLVMKFMAFIVFREIVILTFRLFFHRQLHYILKRKPIKDGNQTSCLRT